MEKKKKTKNKKRFTWVNLAQLLTVAALLLWMQWAVDSGRVLTIFVASPTSIVEEGIKIITDGTLWPHLLLTIQEALAGYLSAVVVGIAVGLLWTLFPVSEKYMNVFCSAIMAVPKVAILPLLILWFGIGFQSKAFLVFLFSVFTILYNTVTGAKECKKEYLKVARVFRANRFQTVFLVIIPAALPSIFNGLKLAAATALTGVLFSEMQSARAGLGYLLTESQNLLNTPRMFFLIILITFKSISIPIILVSVIEFAIACNMSVPYYTNTSLAFVTSIVIGTIQLGATVDYAILMTSRYHKERINGASKAEAVTIAHKTSVKSILTSGFGFFAATFGVSLYSQIDMIKSIVTLLARGAVISMVVVICILPAMLWLFDGVIVRTSWDMRKAGIIQRDKEAKKAKLS